jgi:hypothetical protein
MSCAGVPQSFSTVAAVETAYFRLTGKQQLFSEQQLIDCAWQVRTFSLVHIYTKL